MILAATGARRRSQFPTSAPYNVDTPLVTPTYDGSGETVHLDVIDFRQEIGGTWNGWRYWMVHTPYPGSDSSVENPSLLVSADAHTWQTPPGLTNPLYLPTDFYNSDPDIVYDPATGELVLFYRDYKTYKTARSGDGITWPAAASTIEVGGATDLSPAFLRDSGGTWHRWHKNGYATSAASGGPYVTVANHTGLITPWHLNVAFAPGGGYHMLYHVNEGGHRFYAASSADGHSWVTNETPILAAGTAPWSADALYRGAFTLHEAGDRYRVWYCGNGGNVWRVGYTEIPLTEWPALA